MRRVELVQLGLGHVGRAVVEIVMQERERWARGCNLKIEYRAVADTSGALAGEQLLPKALRLKEAGGSLSELGVEPLEKVLTSEPEAGVTRIVVDLATHGGSYPQDLLGVRNGAYLVLSNKGPLSGPAREYYDLVHVIPGRLWFEATVGAGMPIISTLKELLASGDEVFEIQASPSGTLGFLMTRVEEGCTFSEAVREAVELHYAEPDPRDDLSGLDVARKSIILARTMGRQIEPEEIPYESLVPEGLEEVPLEEFMRLLPEADEEFARRQRAVEPGHMLRYLARIPSEGPVEVGLRDTPVESPFGPISGPENVFAFHTRRYPPELPLTVSGPGAGPERTASGVVLDILDIVHKAVEDDGEEANYE